MKTFIYVNGIEIEAIETSRDAETIKKLKNWNEVIELPEGRTIKDLVDEEVILTPEGFKFDEEYNGFVQMTSKEKYQAELMSEEELLAEIRSRRNTLLAETDYIMTNDSSVSDDCKTSFEIYRQNLRDMLNEEQFDILNVSWPVKPAYVKI